jgi:hypothetical protein
MRPGNTNQADGFSYTRLRRDSCEQNRIALSAEVSFAKSFSVCWNLSTITFQIPPHNYKELDLQNFFHKNMQRPK